LGTTVRNHNPIREEIKKIFNSDSVCYHSVQKLLSSCLQPRNIKIRIYKTVLPVVQHGCEIWREGGREEHRLRVFEYRLLRRIFGLKRDEVTGGWSFITGTLHQV
jgi:hypothetical protein